MAHPENIFIRPVEKSGLPALREIARSTFAGTFSTQNAASDMDKYLNDNFSLEKLTAEFETPGALFFFAEIAGKVIGYLKVNWGAAQTESMPGNMLEIERIYVLAEYQGKKVGKALFEKALRIAQEKRMDAIWLGVWEKNTAALHFYRNRGFVEFGTHLFRLGDDEQTDLLMKLEI